MSALVCAVASPSSFRNADRTASPSLDVALVGWARISPAQSYWRSIKRGNVAIKPEQLRLEESGAGAICALIGPVVLLRLQGIHKGNNGVDFLFSGNGVMG